MPEQLPAEVEALHRALRGLAGVRETTTGLKWLTDFEPDSYSLPGELGDLPHALLRRTNGGLSDEALATTEFTLSRDEAGWLTLEFLAWWVRDLSRSGEQVQMRVLALPPKAFEVQFGRTLKFAIDHFAICPGGDPAPMLAKLDERAKSLERAIALYAELLGPVAKRAGRAGKRE
jgi:hypothetical protein